MALMVHFQLNPCAEPFAPTAKTNKVLRHRLGKRKEGDAPVRKYQTQLGCVKFANRRGVGERSPPRDIKNSGAKAERVGAQHNDKRATAVIELAGGSSPSLPIMCGRWLWVASTA